MGRGEINAVLCLKAVLTEGRRMRALYLNSLSWDGLRSDQMLPSQVV